MLIAPGEKTFNQDFTGSIRPSRLSAIGMLKRLVYSRTVACNRALNASTIFV
jgi:hypothetical protein